MKKSSKPEPLRVFIGPLEIAGYYSSLQVGLRGIGVEADLFFFESHPFGYVENTDDTLLRQAIRRCFKSTRGPSALKRVVAYGVLGPLLLFHAVVAALTYDAFIFGFGHSLLPRNFDLPFLRLLRKRIICNVAHGDEARPPYLSGSYRQPDGTLPSLAFLRRQTRRNWSRVQRAHRYADYVVGAPYTSHFAPGPEVNHFALGLPQVFSTLTESKLSCDRSRLDPAEIRAVHAPSNSLVKGTDMIREAVRELRAKGIPISLVELQKVANSEVLREIQRADFVIDQTFSDTPLAGFAAEAARYGIPAIVGGYGLEALRAWVPVDMFPPSITCRPETLGDAIARAATDVKYRTRVGREAQHFVRTQWSAEKVAKRYLTLILGDPPLSWMFDPFEVSYLHGVGQSADDCQAVLGSLVTRFGCGSLKLDHRTDLKAQVLAFAVGDG